MPEPGRYSVPEVARLLGISERAVRKRIAVGSLQAEREGTHWVVTLAEPDGGTGGGTSAVPGGTEGGTTPALVEQAIARTGQQYTSDLRAMLGELRQVYEGQIAAKDETIAELRRRAEAAEEELARISAPTPGGYPPQRSSGYPDQSDAANAYPAPPDGLWERLARWWRGEG